MKLKIRKSFQWWLVYGPDGQVMVVAESWERAKLWACAWIEGRLRKPVIIRN